MLLMVADLCHFVIVFCRSEITIVFVFSPQNNDLTAKLTRNNEINEAKYFAPLFIVFSPRINNTLRLFVISRRTDEITKRRKLQSFRSEKTINTAAKYFAALISHSLISLLRVSFAVISVFVAKTRSRKDEDYHFFFAATTRNDEMAQFNHHRRRPSEIYFAITWIPPPSADLAERQQH